MAKTSVIENKLTDTEVYPGDGAGTVKITLKETGKDDNFHFVSTLEEANTIKTNWDKG